MAAFATDELAHLLGGEVRRQLRPLVASFWRGDEFARGSYSYAKPGHADDRAVLAAPVDDRIFFAGEACSPHYFSTVHGAYETGIAAAEAALKSLGR
jgi:monoamine oxidase